jgi:hypothetical protein
MAWIKTITMDEASPELMAALGETMGLYPEEYGTPIEELAAHNPPGGAAIVMAHSLLPNVLKHSFSAYGHLLSPDLPLSRRDHELIASTVSALNDCFY